MQFDKHMTRAMQLVNHMGTLQPSGKIEAPEEHVRMVTYEAQRALALSEVCGMQTHTCEPGALAYCRTCGRDTLSK